MADVPKSATPLPPSTQGQGQTTPPPADAAPSGTPPPASAPRAKDPGPLRGWAAALGEALFSPLCHLCAAPAPWDVPVCKGCSEAILPITPGCPRCGLPGAPELCEPCLASPPAYDRARSFGIFEGPLREAIHTFKFNDAPQVGRWLGAFIAPAIPALLPPPKSTLVVPVPLPAHRLKARGYNQARVLGEPIAASLGLPIIDALTRESTEGSQAKVGRKRRLARLRGAFTLVAQVRGQRILLIDDVMTTGATANACAQALKEGGAAGVDILTAARTPA